MLANSPSLWQNTWEKSTYKENKFRLLISAHGLLSPLFWGLWQDVTEESAHLMAAGKQKEKKSPGIQGTLLMTKLSSTMCYVLKVPPPPNRLQMAMKPLVHKPWRDTSKRSICITICFWCLMDILCSLHFFFFFCQYEQSSCETLLQEFLLIYVPISFGKYHAELKGRFMFGKLEGRCCILFIDFVFLWFLLLFREFFSTYYRNILLFCFCFFNCCAGWEYIVAFTKVLKMYQIYHTWNHPPLLLSFIPPLHPFLE
jgi:hypothetical protein